MADGMDRSGPAGDGNGADDGGAEEAFEALRAEVAALRRGVELVFQGLQERASGQAGADLPDYSPTLGAIVQELKAVGVRLGAIERTPALASTPVEQVNGLRRVLHEAGEDGRRGFEHSQGRLDDAVRALQGMVRGAHERHEQKRWLWAVGAASAVGGMVLWILATAMLPGGAGPWLAGLAFGGQWKAGQIMLEDANPKLWDRMVRLHRACPQESTTELCEAAMVLRTNVPIIPVQPVPTPPMPDGTRGPAFGTVPGPARGRVGR